MDLDIHNLSYRYTEIIDCDSRIDGWTKTYNKDSVFTILAWNLKRSKYNKIASVSQTRLVLLFKNPNCFSPVKFIVVLRSRDV